MPGNSDNESRLILRGIFISIDHRTNPTIEIFNASVVIIKQCLKRDICFFSSPRCASYYLNLLFRKDIPESMVDVTYPTRIINNIFQPKNELQKRKTNRNFSRIVRTLYMFVYYVNLR